MNEQEPAQEAILPFTEEINSNPGLLSLLYDAALLPEQVATIKDARSMIAIVLAYRLGRQAGEGSPA